MTKRSKDGPLDPNSSNLPIESAAPALPPGRLLKRGDVAARYGVSVSSVRRMEGRELEPIVGPDNVRYFVEEQVEAVFLRVRRTRWADESGPPPELAARTFAMLQAGATTVDIVKTLELAPVAVEALAACWARLSQTVVLDAAHVRSVRQSLGLQWITNEAELLAAVSDYKGSSPDHCVLCHDVLAYYCSSCARAAGVNTLLREDEEHLFQEGDVP